MRIAFLPLFPLLVVAACTSPTVAPPEAPVSISLLLPAGNPDALKQANDRCATLGKTAVAKGDEKQGAVFDCQ